MSNTRIPKFTAEHSLSKWDGSYASNPVTQGNKLEITPQQVHRIASRNWAWPYDHPVRCFGCIAGMQTCCQIIGYGMFGQPRYLCYENPC